MRIKRHYIIISLLLLIGIAMTVWFLRPRGTVDLTIAPDEVTMRIDGAGRTVTHGQRLTLAPGDYTVEFQRQGFSSEQLSFQITNRETTAITVALTPQSDAAKQLFADNATYQKIAATYKKQKQDRFLRLLPLASTGFSLYDCSSLKAPRSQAPAAICIMTDKPTGEADARRYITRQGYSLEGLDVMTGKNSLVVLAQTDSYRIETDLTAASDHQRVYVTPINAPFVPSSATHDAHLESVKADVLSYLSGAGYDLEELIVYYSNTYLSRYNPDIHGH